jgi:hypothetical protein
MTSPHSLRRCAVDAAPTAGWKAVQSESLRLTRVRGVLLASEALGLGEIVRRQLACNSIAIHVRSAIHSGAVHLTSPFGAHMVRA